MAKGMGMLPKAALGVGVVSLAVYAVWKLWPKSAGGGELLPQQTQDMPVGGGELLPQQTQAFNTTAFGGPSRGDSKGSQPEGGVPVGVWGSTYVPPYVE